MEDFKFETGCNLDRGWYCNIRKTFLGDSGYDAEQKAKEYVETLVVREEMMEDA